MLKKKNVVKGIVLTVLSANLVLSPIYASAASQVLDKGSQGQNVTQLQKNLKTLGFFNANVTGYYGGITISSVKKLQKKYGIDQDGITGKKTLSLIDSLLKKISTPSESVKTSSSRDVPTVTKTSISTVSRGGFERDGYLIPWFNGVENIFSIGKVATVVDIQTGLSFNVKRTYGYNHADCETLTADDTAIMKEIYGGQWSWNRRPVAVLVDDYKIAGSIAGMPHAGDEDLPGNIFVNWRSSGYGSGINLDSVKGNVMDGHFDIHFLGSKTHGTNRVDENHQNAVQQAAAWMKTNIN